MYVISRMIKVEKDLSTKLVNQFNHESPMLTFKGFVKREILLDKKNKAFDVVNISTYFENKKAFYQWEGSPEHIALHKDSKNDHHKKPEGVLGVEAHFYETVLLQAYREK
ncbi:antibiotic biosynthesis monooxygenase [Mycoplasmatota bacterium]|nr:antibiotic biosynthesis monooxygenase [Mycoplasmatota bacterium]